MFGHIALAVLYSLGRRSNPFKIIDPTDLGAIIVVLQPMPDAEYLPFYRRS